MTEEQAKTRWCPFVRFVFGATDYPAGNRFDGDSETAADARSQSLCIASACMAWRVSIPADPGNSAYPKGDFYCGLAGVPQ